eukprot:2314583-Pyramimonas_sp.AAC.1
MPSSCRRTKSKMSIMSMKLSKYAVVWSPARFTRSITFSVASLSRVTVSGVKPLANLASSAKVAGFTVCAVSNHVNSTLELLLPVDA